MTARPAWLPVLALLLLAAGCRQGHTFRAANLPPQLTAPRVSSIQQMDLSVLNRSGGNHDVLHEGDLVKVRVVTGVEQHEPRAWELNIDGQGNVQVPLIGPVYLAGLRPSQAAEAIRLESMRRGKYINPNVSVVLAQRRTHAITVAGAVEEPGTYELPAHGSDLLSALMEAGGPNEDAGTIIEIRHPPQPAGAESGGNRLAGFPGQDVMLPPRTVRVDLEQVMQQGGGEFRLPDGATVMVMNRPKQFIHVTGLVNRPDQFEIPDDQELRLLSALALAGGRRLEVADKVFVIRHVPGAGEAAVIEASIREAKRNGAANLRLAAGDIVSVEETPLTFVVGTIRDFVRFGFTSAIPGL